MTTENLFCRITVDIAARHGVRSVYCSPGSRNAPLLMAVSAHPDLEPKVVVDERSAAFMALGEAEVSRRPVMLICTSGTALLNYGPAVAEAYYSGIPLIVISADRPAEWIDQDDSQTLRQFEALSNFVKRSYDLPVFKTDAGSRGENLRWFVERSVNDALLSALSPKQGPVHINIQLDTPLGAIREYSEEEGRYIELLRGDGDLTRECMLSLAQEASQLKVLIVCGFSMPDDKLRKSLLSLSRYPNVVIMAETLSNTATAHSDWHIIDSLLSRAGEEEKKNLKPDLVITIGGALVSRMIKEYLRSYRPSKHWHVGFTGNTIDCLKSLTTRIECHPERFLRQLAAAMRGLSVIKGYSELWKESRLRTAKENARRLMTTPWSDLKAFQIISEKFPKKTNLFLSNGTCVRYDQLFGIRSHATFCNRGVSGIDGCTSAAVGGAMASNLPTILITGDMSFSYDIGVLGSSLLPDSLKIIVIRNGGGGIFRFIQSTSSLPEDILSEMFCVNQFLPLEELAKAWCLGYFKASDESSLKEALTELLKYPHAAILEIETDGKLSAHILKEWLNR